MKLKSCNISNNYYLKKEETFKCNDCESNKQKNKIDKEELKK